MTNKIEWDKKYSVGVPELDDFQKGVLEKFNELIELNAGKVDAKAVANVISDINDYSKVFFSKEEKILKANNYPDRESHSKSHRRFIKNAISLRREIAEDINNLTMDTIIELRDWLIDHFETKDALYAPFLRINQYIKDSQKKD